MKKRISPVIANHRKKLALVIAVAAVQSNAFALGGLDKANSAAEDIKTGLYALVGVIALIYMIYLGVMAFTEKKSWSDFGWGVVHVSVVGGAVALGTWAWALFA
jgi:glucose-6-phosphate-specific signal transduction histidine kinase